MTVNIMWVAGDLDKALEEMDISGEVHVRRVDGSTSMYEQVMNGAEYRPLEDGVYKFDDGGPRIVSYQDFVADVSASEIYQGFDENGAYLKRQLTDPPV